MNIINKKFFVERIHSTDEAILVKNILDGYRFWVPKAIVKQHLEFRNKPKELTYHLIELPRNFKIKYLPKELKSYSVVAFGVTTALEVLIENEYLVSFQVYDIERGCICYVVKKSATVERTKKSFMGRPIYIVKIPEDYVLKQHPIQNKIFKKMKLPIPEHFFFQDDYERDLRKNQTRSLRKVLLKKFKMARQEFQQLVDEITIKTMFGVDLKTEQTDYTYCMGCRGEPLIDDFLCKKCRKELEKPILTELTQLKQFLPQLFFMDPLEILFLDRGIKYRNRVWRWFHPQSWKYGPQSGRIKNYLGAD